MKFYLSLLFLINSVFGTLCVCIFIKKNGFGESCIANEQCNDTLLCLNGICSCGNCSYLIGYQCVYSRLCSAFSITNPILSPFNFSITLRNFAIVNNSYYVADRDNRRILIFNRTGQFQRQINATRPMFVLNVGSNFYYTSDTIGIVKTDLNFNLQANYLPTVNPSGYRSIYFDSISQKLLITNAMNFNYEEFDLNLVPSPSTFNSSIDGTSHGIYMHDDFIYISTLTGRIIKVRNYTRISSFQTLCTSNIAQIVIDQAGIMTVPCLRNNTIFFYHVNGTYLNKRINVDSQALFADFGLDGRFAIVSQAKFSLVN